MNQKTDQFGGVNFAVSINRWLTDNPGWTLVNVFPVQVEKIGGAEAQVVALFQREERRADPQPETGRALNFSVNPDGRLSLWDDEQTALRGKEDGEMSFSLVLTAAQEARVVDMASRARKPRQQ